MSKRQKIEFNNNVEFVLACRALLEAPEGYEYAYNELDGDFRSRYVRSCFGGLSILEIEGPRQPCH